MTKRLAIFFFYDGEGIVDDYVPHLLNHLRPFVDRIVFVSNGALTKTSEIKARQSSDQLLVRKNTGFDVWAYKEAIEHIGFESIGTYDELILMNHTCYGPIFPFGEMFSEMERRPDDFWGISIHKALTPNPYTGFGTLPSHIQSHFIAVRKPLLTSSAFADYWRSMEPINSYDDSVQKHESRFTNYFFKLGYTYSAYLNANDFHTPYPIFIEIERSIELRSPILKRRLFFHDPQFQESVGVSLPRALDRLAEVSDYDPALIWKNIVREAKPRALMTNSGNLRILDDQLGTVAPADLRVGILAHIANAVSIEMLFECVAKFPVGTNVLITTESEELAAKIEARWTEGQKRRLQVRVVPRDDSYGAATLVGEHTAPWLEEGRYDLVCRLQDYFTDNTLSLPKLYQDHTIDSTVNTPGYVSNVIDLFSSTPWLGLAFPAFLHIETVRWPNHRQSVEGILSELDIANRPDDIPLGPQLGIFWFRPRALDKLFAHDRQTKQVDREHGQAILQSLASIAASAGHTVMEIMPKSVAQRTYVRLDYRLHGAEAQKSVRRAARDLIDLIKVSLKHRRPWLFWALRPIYLIFDPIVRRVLR